MKKTMLLAAGVAALLAMPAAASANDNTGSSPRQTCLRVGQLNDFKTPDNKTLIVTDDLHKKFKVILFTTCSGLTFRQTIAVDSPGSSTLSCLAPGDTIITHQSGAGTQRCPIRSVTAYTPEMEKADKDAKEQAALDKRMTE